MALAVCDCASRTCCSVNRLFPKTSASAVVGSPTVRVECSMMPARPARKPAMRYVTKVTFGIEMPHRRAVAGLEPVATM